MLKKKKSKPPKLRVVSNAKQHELAALHRKIRANILAAFTTTRASPPSRRGLARG